MGKRKKIRLSKKYALLFLVPSLAGVLLFYVIPYVAVLFYSIVDNPVKKQFVGISNFHSLIQNEAFRLAVFNSVQFSILAVPLAVGLSLGLALLLDCKIPFKSQFRTFFLSPVMVPVASVVLVWRILFDNNGALNAMLTSFGMDKIDWLKSAYSHFVIVILFLWKNLGYNMILFMAAFGSIPKEVIEVAQLEGARSLQIFLHIKLRYLSPTIFFLTLISLINSFKVFREVYILTGDYPYETLYLLQHFMNNTFRTMDYQKMSAAAILISIALILIIGILFLLEQWFGKDMEG